MINGRKIALLMSPTFHPRSLFRNAEPGAIYELLLARMWQESTGVTPAATSSPVGFVEDGKHGYARGNELIANGAAPISGTTSWSASGSGSPTLTNDAGVLTLTSTGIGSLLAINTLSLTAETTYELLVTVTAKNGAIAIRTAGGGLDATFLTLNVGANRYIVKPTASGVLNIGNAGSLAAGSSVSFSSVSARVVSGAHKIQATSAARPNLAAGPKLDYDAVDDALVATFPVDMGTACTVARSVPGSGASILTGQTIGTTYSDNTDHHALVIINRALTPKETSDLTKWLNRKAGV